MKILGLLHFSTLFAYINRRNGGDLMSLLTIAAKDLEKYIRGNQGVIIDIREEEEYKQGHIPGAINIPFEGVNETKMPFSKDTTIIFYCDRGNASLLLGRYYSRKGYNVINIYGGFRAYRGEISVD